MREAAYTCLIRGLCHAAGIAEWQEVVSGGHIEVEGRVVGLINAEGGEQDHDELMVHVELDPVVPSDEGLYLRLLQANLRREVGLKGSFGVHPDTGHAVYSLGLHAGPDMSGAGLAELLGAQVVAAAAALDEIRAPR